MTTPPDSQTPDTRQTPDAPLPARLPELPGGELKAIELLSASQNSTVTRARFKDARETVIVKRLHGSPLTSDRVARYHQEYLLSHRLDCPGVVHALSMGQDGDQLTILFRDCGGYALRLWMETTPLPSLDQFLPLALRICEGLAELHHHHIIHKDLNPSNIVWNPESNAVELIDLGISSQLTHETPQLKAPAVLEGTLPYLSPEQTGRMNRRLDYRTDFYSLGVTFFEMLTGRLPYEHSDPLALLHAHMAAAIPSVRSLRPEIPAMLSKLVQRLMAKQAEDRYQSVHGLRYDLNQCLEDWRKTGDIAEFPLGQQDFTPVLRLPDRLYGREQQLEQMLEAFEATRTGRRQLLLVSGYSGIGKSSLVNELHKPITARRGSFASGKFDQYNRGIAYSALSQALRGLFQQMLAEPEAVLRPLRRELKSALGSNAGVATELVSELGLLLGEVTPVEPLAGQEAQNRFNQVMRKLLATLSQPERPLVLFLDDLQWADQASLHLLENLLSDESLQHLLLIGAYRDNEVMEGHPVLRTVRALERAQVSLVQLQLPPLAPEQLGQLLSDALNQPAEALLPLTDLIHRHTLGNPFFVGQFLREIHRRELLTCDDRTGRWHWDLDGIEAQSFTDNVIDLLADSLRLLPEPTQRVMEAAACIGNQFSLELLSWVLEKPLLEVVDALWPGLEKGYLESASGSNLMALAQLNARRVEERILRCRFVHDRIQQSAYSRLNETQREHLHLKIGQQMLSHLTPDQREAQLFALVAQLNQGHRQLPSAEERLQLARLNQEVARKARRSTAYDSAAQALQLARELLADQPWQAHDRLNFELHLELAECAYLLGRFDEADALYPLLKTQARTLEASLEIGMVQADHYLLQARHAEGLKVARECFALVQLAVPTASAELEQALQAEMTRIDELLDGRPVERVVELPPMTDPIQVAMVRLAYGMFLNAFLSGQGTLAFLSLSFGARLSLSHGNCALSGYVYVGYGMVLYLLKKAYVQGYRFGHTGVLISERFPELSTRCKTQFLFAADLHSWTQPIRNGQQYYNRAYQLALECGDWVTLGYVVAQSASDRFTSGVPLTELLPIFQEQRQLLKRAQNEDGMGLLQVASLIPIQQLVGLSQEEVAATGDDFSEAQYLTRHADNLFYLAWHSSGQLRMAYLLGQEARYATLAEQVQIVEQFVPSHAKVPECCFYGALLRLELRQRASTETEKQRHEQELERLLSRLREFAVACPANVRHRLALVLGERARLEGRYGEAMEHLETSIRLAREHGYLQIEALGLELYARLWLTLQRPALATPLLQEARDRYAAWGANAVVERLMNLYPSILMPPGPSDLPAPRTITSQPPRTAKHTTSSMHPLLKLDFDSMKRASQTLSTQLDIEEASRNLLHLLMITAGAQRCVRIDLEPGGNPATLTAQVDETGVHALPPVSLDSPEAEGLLGTSIARFVMRSQRVVVLAQAWSGGEFVQDPYVQTQKVRSVLCLPLQSQGQLQGVLYLENNLSEGVFTPERVEMLLPLATQLAVTLTNARLFRDLDQYKNNLEQLVEARTRALNETLATLKATQKELVQSARLASLGNTVAGVAHELNTPLGVALTAESLMSEDLAQLREGLEMPVPDIAELKAILEQVMEASQLTRLNLERAAQLVKTFKQVAVDRSRAELRSLHVKSYLEEVILSLSPLTKRLHLTVDFLAKSQDPVYVCDAGILAQVLTNLLENSGIHGYHGKGGRVEIGVYALPTGIQIDVQDFGVGMSEEVAASAFDPFFSTHRQHGGTGLGLHVVHNAIKEGLGGELCLTTQPGKGTCLTLLLPPHEVHGTPRELVP